MSHELYDPAKTDGPESFSSAWPSNLIDGPGGNDTLSDKDEKGILEHSLRPFISGRREAALGSNHDPYRQGIYGTNSVGDND